MQEMHFYSALPTAAIKTQKEISKFQYAKLSYELGYQDEALNSLSSFLNDYPNSTYNTEAKDLLVIGA